MTFTEEQKLGQKKGKQKRANLAKFNAKFVIWLGKKICRNSSRKATEGTIQAHQKQEICQIFYSGSS